jgi:hypothetical protein
MIAYQATSSAMQKMTTSGGGRLDDQQLFLCKTQGRTEVKQQSTSNMEEEYSLEEMLSKNHSFLCCGLYYMF